MELSLQDQVRANARQVSANKPASVTAFVHIGLALSVRHGRILRVPKAWANYLIQGMPLFFAER
jgi:hypothetical protein